MITWRHTDADFPYPWTLDTKILIFYERTWGWQLHIAELIANGGIHLNRTEVAPIADAGFAVLQICLSYFETIAKYEDGYDRSGDSRNYFKMGVKSVFPRLAAQHLEPLLDKLYVGARCGLYHGSMTCFGVAVSGDTAEAIVYDAAQGSLTINPHRLPSELAAHLRSYRQKLSDASQTRLRTNFEKRFDMEYPVRVTTAALQVGQARITGEILSPQSGSYYQLSSGVQLPQTSS